MNSLSNYTTLKGFNILRMSMKIWRFSEKLWKFHDTFKLIQKLNMFQIMFIRHLFMTRNFPYITISVDLVNI